MVPVFISDWYIAAFSGEASMTRSSKAMRPVDSRAMSSAKRSFI